MSGLNPNSPFCRLASGKNQFPARDWQVLTTRKGGSKRPALQSDELQIPAYQA